jgi:hypothetical protein
MSVPLSNCYRFLLGFDIAFVSSPIDPDGSSTLSRHYPHNKDQAVSNFGLQER